MKTAIETAADAWNEAPLHIKMMAGVYVTPILAALADLQRQFNDLGRGVSKRVGELEDKINGKS